ncbi:MAG: MBL fold metallo-hydrolase RNA specificity domain-containing protein [Aeromicrobium sp.]
MSERADEGPMSDDSASGPNAPASLSFLGAAGTVTGSKFLVETAGERILVDCGLFQGEREWRRRNWDPLPVDPSSIGAVVLTHAHLDHCGYLPALARDGFSGDIVCTPGTAALAEVVLRDAAHLQEQDARFADEGGYSKHKPPLPLYDSADAESAIALLRPVEHGAWARLPGRAQVRLQRAGHILGSAFAELDVQDVRVLFSGDMGRPDHELLSPPETPDDADVVVVESTYGDRQHQIAGDEAFAAAIRRVYDREGVALMPAFAIDRTPVLLMALSRMVRDGLIPDQPVFVDSPMALRALRIYQDALESHDQQFRPELIADPSLLEPTRLRLMFSSEDSEKLNAPKGPCIVVSASGMASGGRVLHHLKKQLPNPRNAVIFTGFQVPGTRGRQLVDGARQVKIHGHYVPVRAEVTMVEGFSAHADAGQLIEWLRPMKPPEVAYVVHGETHAAETFAGRLDRELGWNAVVPGYQERVSLT